MPPPVPPFVIRSQPRFWVMFWRGVRGRCPVCGGRRAWFTGWFARAESCHTCGFRWARNTDGFMTGSMTINIIITFATLAIALGGVTFATYPNLPTLVLTATLVGVSVVLPVLLHPVSCTMWAAVDLAMRPLEPEDLAHIDERHRQG